MKAAAEDGIEQHLLASIREEGWRAFAEGGIPPCMNCSLRPATTMASWKPSWITTGTESVLTKAVIGSAKRQNDRAGDGQ
jgi:hypothetical protein